MSFVVDQMATDQSYSGLVSFKINLFDIMYFVFYCVKTTNIKDVQFMVTSQVQNTRSWASDVSVNFCKFCQFTVERFQNTNRVYPRTMTC